MQEVPAIRVVAATAVEGVAVDIQPVVGSDFVLWFDMDSMYISDVYESATTLSIFPTNSMIWYVCMSYSCIIWIWIWMNTTVYSHCFIFVFACRVILNDYSFSKQCKNLHKTDLGTTNWTSMTWICIKKQANLVRIVAKAGDRVENRNTDFCWPSWAINFDNQNTLFSIGSSVWWCQNPYFYRLLHSTANYCNHSYE